MKYIVVENKEDQQNEFLYDIADFFWNNGNEVYISSNYSTANFEQIIQECDCIVMLNYQNVCFKKAIKAFQNSVALKKSIRQKNFFLFSENGVYTDAIPFPHKIFHFDTFCKRELTRFFIWCSKLRLFQQHEIIN
ncbi:hypothetical protein G6R40_02340 [Chryseobacterium sp. POL2]|uniref:hypothetical protein n=1 Tax=Chryseobacterium sp. POL2 TaxID=2713414 RepID=UPI0013E15B76|nr:hypothetical protein [Chryseobacterium sp. POL2]QIG88570.1 hypothetical protein G6R40_02340 [Chryseobacterium sp. POL2]